MVRLSSPRSIVIFGANGFIGGTTARILREAGHDVIGITSRDADLADVDEVLKLDVPPGALWLLAAARSPDYDGDIYDTNCNIVRAVAALAQHTRPAGILLLSSVDIYGREDVTLPLDEDSPRKPRSPYAESKVFAEHHLSDVCGWEIPHYVLCLPGVYGPGDTHSGPVRSFIEAALDRRPIDVYGDGEQLRDLLFVDDVAAIVERWGVEPVFGRANAVHGRSISLNQMIALVRMEVEPDLEVRYHDAPQYDLTFEESSLPWPGLSLTPPEVGIPETVRRVRVLREGGVAHAG